MIAFLKWLIIGHNHKWEIHSETRLEQPQYDEEGEFYMAAGTRFVLRCSGCGNIKREDFI